MIINKKNLVFFIFFTLCFTLPADSYEDGERYFSGNRPTDAIPYFQKALLETVTNPLVYNYLGICYLQTGQNDKALEIFSKGLTISGTSKKALYFNAGNVCFLQQDYEKAKEYYGYAISADSLYAKAYLNRANSNLKLGNYQNSIDDYTNYLVIDMESTQKEAVELMIEALKQELTNQAVKSERLAEEEARINAEKEKLATQKAADDKLAAEQAAATAAQQAQIEAGNVAKQAARRKKLLEEVAAELQQTESTNLTAGTEGIMEYSDEDSELD